MVSGYLTYRMNDRSLAQSLSIPVFEVPVRDGRILWSLVTSDQILNVTIQPDGKWTLFVWSLKNFLPIYDWTVIIGLYKVISINLGNHQWVSWFVSRLSSWSPNLVIFIFKLHRLQTIRTRIEYIMIILRNKDLWRVKLETQFLKLIYKFSGRKPLDRCI